MAAIRTGATAHPGEPHEKAEEEGRGIPILADVASIEAEEPREHANRCHKEGTTRLSVAGQLRCVQFRSPFVNHISTTHTCMSDSVIQDEEGST